MSATWTPRSPISLKPEHHPTIGYIRAIRAKLPDEFPGSVFYFQTADIVSQVLNFGLSAPIDVQIQDVNFDRAQALAQELLRRMHVIPGVADAHLVQVLNYPALQVDVDRLRAIKMGIAQRDVANNMLISLSSSALVSPNFFLNPQNNVNYFVSVQTPLEQINTVGDLLDTPVSKPDPSLAAANTALPGAPVMRLADIANVYPRTSLESVNHYTVQREIDIAANVDGRDLGSHRRRHPAGYRRGQQGAADHHAYLHPRSERGDEVLVPQPRAGHDPRGAAGLCAAGGAVPVLGRSVHHHDGGAGRADRHHLDAGADRHHHQRRIADGRDHVDRHLGVELDPGGELRQRPARRARRSDRSPR